MAMTPPPPPPIRGARALAIFGDSITTDHISPAGSIPPGSPAGLWLRSHGVAPADFNSYGARRGQHEVMLRGSLAGVRLRNRALPPGSDGQAVEGGFALHQPDGALDTLFAVAMAYQREGTPTLLFAGEAYGSGSSRDWAAKGTRLLGVRAVVARSFERIHRANLIGMGVLPLQFMEGDSVDSLHLRGDERFDLPGADGPLAPGQQLTLHIERADGRRLACALRLRIDTPVEAEYHRHGGILPYVLRERLSSVEEMTT
jgi:aconitate hydratase